MTFSAFFIYVCTMTFTPGPNNIMSMSIAGQRGFRRAMHYSVGVGLGFFLLLLLAAVFMKLLEAFIPRIELVMKIIGAAYMLYLAFIIVRDKPHKEKEGKRHVLRPDSVITGTLLQFINPKGVLYSITCMGTYVLLVTSSPFVVALYAAGLAFMGVLSTTLWALCGAVFVNVFSKHKKIINLLLALLLVYCVVTLFL